MKALLFDMDGVLVDVSQSYRVAIKKTAEFFTGDDISDKDIQVLKDKGGFNNDWDLTEELILKRGKTIDKQEIIDKFQEFYLGKGDGGLIQNERWILDKKVLVELKRKFKLGIVTGRPKAEAEFALRNNDMSDYFDVLVAMEDTVEQKPDPSPIRLALKGLDCTEGFYIGDTIDDAKMAANAGIPFILVRPPGVDVDIEKILSDTDTGFVLDDINEIKKVIEIEISRTSKIK